MLERGCVRKYETLEALADGETINLEGLRASIAEWNKAVEEGKDAHYGRYVNKLAKPMSQGPWYVSQMVPKVHHCRERTDPRALRRRRSHGRRARRRSSRLLRHYGLHRLRAHCRKERCCRLSVRITNG